MSAIWRYSVYCVVGGRYSRSLNSPPFFMILGSFKSIIMLFQGPNKDTGARVWIPQIFCIFCFGSGYPRSLDSSLIPMVQGSFKSTKMPFKGPNRSTGAHVRMLEIFHILCFGILGNWSCDHPPESPP